MPGSRLEDSHDLLLGDETAEGREVRLAVVGLEQDPEAFEVGRVTEVVAADGLARLFVKGRFGLDEAGLPAPQPFHEALRPIEQPQEQALLLLRRRSCHASPPLISGTPGPLRPQKP
jgi:hypothetical protein